MGNLELLRSAVYLDKESNMDEDGRVKVASKDFNKMFLDPYKSFTLNTLARLASNEEGPIKYDNTMIRDISGLYESIKSYIIMNLRDLLIATGAGFIDDLSSQFLYDEDEDMDDHYEFEFPFSMITKNEKDIVEEAYTEVFKNFNLKELVEYHTNLDPKNEMDSQCIGDVTIQRRIGILFDSLYSVLLRTYFDRLIVEIATYYLGKPNFIKGFYASFLEQEEFIPYEDNGRNNAYTFISVALRDMIQDRLETFKDGLFVMVNTVSSMILGYSQYSYDMSFEEYIQNNPFVGEIMHEKYDNEDDEEESEEEVKEYGKAV